MDQDLEHLKILSIFHYVVGGLSALFACLPIIHLVVGIIFITTSSSPGANTNAPPAFIGWIFVCIAGAIILAGWTSAVCVVLAGRFLSRQTHYTFCLVVGAVECLFFPFGTVLGVFTIVVLMRESVKEIFEKNRAPAPSIY